MNWDAVLLYIFLACLLMLPGAILAAMFAQ